MTQRFIESVLVCRSRAANEALRLEFERLVWADIDERAAFEAMRLYWLERYGPSAQQFQEYYDNGYLPERLREMLALVADRPTSYLDVGYGSGRVTAELVRRWNLDLRSATGVEIASPHPNTVGNFIQLVVPGNAKWSLPLETDSVHLVTLFHVLHHSPVSPEMVLSEVRRVLRSDGHLVVREHDVTAPSQRLFLQFVELLFNIVVHGGSETSHEVCEYRSAMDWVDTLNAVGFSTQRLICFRRRRDHLDVDLQCVPQPSRGSRSALPVALHCPMEVR
jgi:SAM-dependent methyltransferase